MGRPLVYLHVGGPKTGTTYLQEVLWHNREELRRDGLLYPGRFHGSHFHAAQDLQSFAFNGHADPHVPGAWSRLLDEARSHQGNVLISHEVFALAAAEHIDRAMQALSFAEVHIVYTIRDLARQIPSVWQEDLKNRHSLSFGEFVRGLRGEEPDPHDLVTLFWRYQDPVRVLQRWGAAVPPDRVHVVTVPPAGTDPGLLWRRFAGTIGIDPARYSSDVTHAANQSLGVIEANLLRRMNPMLRDELDWPTYQRWVTRTLTKSVFAARRPIPIALPVAEYGWVLERSQQFVADLHAAGYDVVGNLHDVLPAAPSPDGGHRHPDEVSEAEQLDAAMHALAGLIRQLREETPAARPMPAALPQDPLTLFRLSVQQLSRHHPSVMRLRQAYRLGKQTLSRLHDVARR